MKSKSWLISLFLILFLVGSFFVQGVLAVDSDAIEVTNETELVSAIETGGYIKLNSDINISSTLFINKDTTLDLNGYMLRQTAQLTVINGTGLNKKTLTITDSRPDFNVHYFIKHENKQWEYVEEKTDGVEYEEIKGGIITGGYNKTDASSSGGGAIKLNDASDYVVINGGTIVGNYARRAGGSSYGGAVTLNNGRICGNAGGKFAGAIALSGNFTMTGGLIEDNYSPSGDNEYDFNITDISIGQSSKFTMTGGVIKANIATVKSSSKSTLTISGDALFVGNIYLQNGIQANVTGGKIIGRIRMTKGSFTMSDGSITGGIANDTEINYFGNNGGGVSVEGGNFTMTGGSIFENKASLNGGGVYVNGGTFIMNGGSIYSNEANSGGGVFVNSGNATITGGSIGLLDKGNIASLNGGGIDVSGGIVTISGGNIFYNKTLNNGGGLYLGGGTLNVENGLISNNTAINGAGAYVLNTEFNLTGGTFKNNISENYGGGFYVGNGSVVNLSNGVISNNEALNGGGSYVNGGTFILTGGDASYNKASKFGGGIYVLDGKVELDGGSITNNTSLDGAGGYISDGIFILNGGSIIHNKASNNGGGLYISNTESTLSNGVISNNEALNGGGFYQTEDDGVTSTTLSGTCYVNNNKAVLGNGGGIYIDGGSTFRIVNGKVIYNSATGVPKDTDIKSFVYDNNVATTNEMVYAKDSSSGVGGGIYIKNGTFTMKNEDGTYGNAAIFGNDATYAADDLFAYGNGLTSFDAIPVIDMIKDDAYLNSTDWFEDYPKGEYHASLKISDNSSKITSNNRFKKITNETLLVTADSVLSTSADYICITMGANVGTIILNIDDFSVGSDNSFVYLIEDINNNIKMRVSVIKGKETKIINVPIGNYKITLENNWSWRYNNDFIATIIKGDTSSVLESSNSININVVGGQTLKINTEYEISSKKYLSKNIFIKIPLYLDENLF